MSNTATAQKDELQKLEQSHASNAAELTQQIEERLGVTEARANGAAEHAQRLEKRLDGTDAQVGDLQQLLGNHGESVDNHTAELRVSVSVHVCLNLTYMHCQVEVALGCLLCEPLCDLECTAPHLVCLCTRIAGPDRQKRSRGSGISRGAAAADRLKNRGHLCSRGGTV